MALLMEEMLAYQDGIVARVDATVAGQVDILEIVGRIFTTPKGTKHCILGGGVSLLSGCSVFSC